MTQALARNTTATATASAKVSRASALPARSPRLAHPRTLSTTRRNVQVHAKGKGKKMNRQGKGMQQPQVRA